MMPRSLQEIIDQAQSLADHFEDGFEPDVTPEAAALRDAAMRCARAEVDVADAVASAVASGATWEAVGFAVGTSGQAAWERYRGVVVHQTACSPTPKIPIHRSCHGVSRSMRWGPWVAR